MSYFGLKKPLHPARKVWIRLTAIVRKLRRSKPVATILPVRPSEPRFHRQHGKRFRARKSSHQRSFAPVYIDELFSQDATVHVEGEKMEKSEWAAMRTSSSQEGEKMVNGEWMAVGTSSIRKGGKMAGSEWMDVGTSSSREREKSEWTAVGITTSQEGEKMAKSEWMAVGTSSSRKGGKGEWTAVGTSSSREGEKSEWTTVGTSSSSRVTGDLGEVDLRAEMFIARIKDGMRLERQRSFGEYHEMLARGL